MRLYEFASDLSDILYESRPSDFYNAAGYTSHSTVHKVNHHGDEYTKGSIWLIASNNDAANVRSKTPFTVSLPVNTILSPYSINGLKKEIERSKRRDGSIYQCHLNFDEKDVFSLTSPENRKHVEMTNKNGAELLKKIDSVAVHGHLPWTKNPEWQSLISRLLLQSGFAAMLFIKDSTMQMCILKPTKADVTKVMSIGQAKSFTGHSSPQQTQNNSKNDLATNWASFKMH